ncbi:hypothetical protein LEMLEM_LOCUS16318 [Lemmus lemmus]
MPVESLSPCHTLRCHHRATVIAMSWHCPGGPSLEQDPLAQGEVQGKCRVSGSADSPNSA